MRRGDFAGAWKVSDEVLRQRVAAGPCWHLPRHEQYVWRGDSLAGKRVLIRCYHGLGDTVQFIRLARPLRRLAAEIAVWVQPELMPLIAGAPGVDRVLALNDGTPDIPYDTDIEVMELPHALRISRADLPGPVPYLSLPDAVRRERCPAGLCVGLVWQAGSWDERRSIPAALLRPLAGIPRVRLFSLQIGALAGDARLIPARRFGTADILGLAERMQRLDLIISVDTLAAHLAGALGRPCWTLLHADCDWRWMRESSDSVWYPTMRLFRQIDPGEWRPVIGAVARALQDEASAVAARSLS